MREERGKVVRCGFVGTRWLVQVELVGPGRVLMLFPRRSPIRVGTEVQIRRVVEMSPRGRERRRVQMVRLGL